MDDGLQGLTPVEPRKPVGIMPNKQHQTFHGFMNGAPYELAVVEFDDQGRCYDRGQMDGVAQRLEALAPDDPPKPGRTSSLSSSCTVGSTTPARMTTI